MSRIDRLEHALVRVEVDGVDLQIAAVHRRGDGVPVVFLHGFGSTKEDYADVVHRRGLDGRPVLAYDAPGCGGSTASEPGAVSIPLLVELVVRMLDLYAIQRAHLVGHSMGGLTALRFATAHPERVASFIDIEGNLAPEDCFLSRQIVEHPRDTPQQFFDDFRARVASSRYAGSALYAAGLTAKVRPEVVRPIFESMVSLSDDEPLLEDFLALPFPRLLMFGEQNNGLSYLPRLAMNGVELAEIPESGHFPMYSNAPAMWHRIVEFIRTAERASSASGQVRHRPR